MLCAITTKAQDKGVRPSKIDTILTGKKPPTQLNATPASRDSARLQQRNQSLLVTADSTNTSSTNLAGTDSLRVTSDTFSLRLSKDTLDAPINYEAEDSAVIFVPEKKIVLYGKTKTTHKDVVLTAPKVQLEQATNIITAFSDKDSLGEIATRARFEQGENKFESDTIQFNLKTQQGLTKNTFTNQSEMFIQGEVIKKVNASTVNISRGRFTTCDLDEPHFAFRANKLKVINNKVAISGPMHPEFEGVPVPIYLPFGYYPLSKGRHSGLLPPQFTATENQGIGLQGLGYYKVLNDNFDVTLRGDLYSYGSWAANLISSYRVRYRYNGALGLSIQNTKYNFKGDPDYNKSKTFQINWNHAVDSRARPGVSFSASVRAGSSKFNRNVTGSVIQPFQNQLTSSIAYQKTWKDKPFNLSLSANHSQNSLTRLFNVSLPDGSFTVNTLYPFERGEDAIGAPKWYEKLGIGYNGTFRNSFAFYDSLFSFAKLLDTMQFGAAHSIPLIVALPSLGPLVVSPNISYQQQWINRRLIRTWNDATKKIDTTFDRGFYTAHSLSFGVGISTSFFGTYQFRHSRVIAIRHSVRPQFSFNYSPNLAKSYYRTVQVDTTGKDFLSYSLYQNPNNIYSGYTNQAFGGISFGIDNSLEMKKRGRKDTLEKKIRLIDGFGFNSSYNFLQDSVRLGDFNLYLRSSLFDKINLNMSANLTPYETDAYGRRVAKFVWRNGFKPGRITNANMSLSTSFKSKPRDPSKGVQTTATRPNSINDPTLLADQQRLADYARRNPSEFVDFNIPYDFSVDVAVSLTRQLQPDGKTYKNLFNSNINFRNSFSLTEKWNFSTNGYYDLNTKKLQAFAMSINRDMHCWQMSLNIAPVGYQRYFNISISPKSSILQNLKVNRTRIFTDF